MKKITTIKFILLAVIAGLFLTASAQAATYTVNSTADTGDGTCDASCTLRDAIAAANGTADDDVIEFDAIVFSTSQTITLISGELTIANNGTLTINGTGADQLSVSGNNASRVFLIPLGANATINAISITSGNGLGAIIPGSGGGIFTIGTTTLNNSTVRNNSASSSGGGINNNGTTTLNNSTVSGNSGSNTGGGINNSGTTMLNNSTVSGNSASNTGGGINNSGITTLNNSTVSGNTAFFGGGGINNNGGTTTLHNSTVSDNSAAFGGGIGNTSGTTTLNNSTVSGNSAASGGGVNNSATTTLNNSTVSGNSADSGGGIGNSNGTTTLNNSTVSNNSASSSGGGINNNGTTMLNNSTVSNNSATDGGGIRNASGTTTLNNSIIANSTGGGGNCSNSDTVNASYSLIEDGSCGVMNGVNNNLTGDPMLGPLQNNGGPTFTHALLTGSIAIDKGNSTLTTDQRGSPRPVDSPVIANAPGGNGADIGSFEVQAVTAASVSISGRVLSGKRGVARAIVHITDQNGNIRTARTSSFGYYRFNDVSVGETYIISIISKRYLFAPQVVFVGDEIGNLDFTALAARQNWAVAPKF